MLRLFTLLILTVMIVSGCTIVQPPIPELSQPQSSGLGIEMALKAPIGFLRFAPDQVYFARIDGLDSPRAHQIMPSNYRKGGRAYLLNARPGIYVAIGALRLVQGQSMGGANRFITEFSRQLAEETMVTVRENELVFMGSYVIDQEVGSGLGDVLLMGMAGEFHYRGTLLDGKKDDQARNEFFRNAREDLAGSGWATRLR